MRAMAPTCPTQPTTATAQPIAHHFERKSSVALWTGRWRSTAGAATAPRCFHRNARFVAIAVPTAKTSPRMMPASTAAVPPSGSSVPPFSSAQAPSHANAGRAARLALPGPRRAHGARVQATDPAAEAVLRPATRSCADRRLNRAGRRLGERVSRNERLGRELCPQVLGRRRGERLGRAGDLLGRTYADHHGAHGGGAGGARPRRPGR